MEVAFREWRSAVGVSPWRASRVANFPALAKLASMEPPPLPRRVLPWVAGAAGWFAVPYWTLGGHAASAYGLSAWFRLGWHTELLGWFGMALLLLGQSAGYVLVVWFATIRRPLGLGLRVVSGSLILANLAWMFSTVPWPKSPDDWVSSLLLLAPLPVWIFILVRRERA